MGKFRVNLKLLKNWGEKKPSIQIQVISGQFYKSKSFDYSIVPKNMLNVDINNVHVTKL